MENRSASWEHHHRCFQSPVMTRVHYIFIEEIRKAGIIQSFNVQSVRTATFQSYYPSLLAVLFWLRSELSGSILRTIMYCFIYCFYIGICILGHAVL